MPETYPVVWFSRLYDAWRDQDVMGGEENHGRRRQRRGRRVPQ
jgi:hypothetical protein